MKNQLANEMKLKNFKAQNVETFFIIILKNTYNKVNNLTKI